jgi:hypothetical protein
MVKMIFSALALIAMTAVSAAAFGDAQCEIARDKNMKIARSAAVLNEFKRHNPCPSTDRRTGSCPGYVIDHIEPLCNCGRDAVDNLQWQTIEDGKVKDRWERRICRSRSAD